MLRLFAAAAFAAIGSAPAKLAAATPFKNPLLSVLTFMLAPLRWFKTLSQIGLLFSAVMANAQPFTGSQDYVKREVMVPMRDGVRLYTAIYTPKTQRENLPFIMVRTPYSCQPYGSAMRRSLGPSPEFEREGYIFVYQDVRGRWMSEGKHIYSPPHKPNKQSYEDIDESTDCYDTVEWLLKNIPENNGRVGVTGISQPGFYATNALFDKHPAVKAVSPQAPVTDRFKGDDDHHNGAFFLAQRFSFMYGFGAPRPLPTSVGPPGFRFPTRNGYEFFLGKTLLDLQNYMRYNNQFWNQVMNHPNYDEFWKSRGIEQHLHGIKDVAVLVVGGWYDGEDLYGALKTYAGLQDRCKGAKSYLVMGPWTHGQSAGGAGDRVGRISFPAPTGPHFRENVQLPFFNFYLKEKGTFNQPKAEMYDSGVGRFDSFDTWPPRNTKPTSLYLAANGTLSRTASVTGKRTYQSDPKNPVPFTAEISTSYPSGYMTEDQTFASNRSDVLTFTGQTLETDLTLAGPIHVRLNASTTGTDCDFVVKLIDVYPADAPDNAAFNPAQKMAGYQRLVRAEIMRARFRNSLSIPEPMIPNKPTKVHYSMNDLYHTFKKGHRLMVQIQSSWFPLVDLNPQTYVDIYKAKLTDFKSATQTIFLGGAEGSKLILPVFRR